VNEQETPVRPRRFTEAELAKAGVTIVSERPCLRCDRCGQAWYPDLLAGGKLPRGYWRCPQGCNVLEQG
jgi:hypothetical protein